MAAYVIFCMEDVSDRDALARYRAAARPTLVEHGPRVLCGPNVTETLEGAAPAGAMVLEFQTIEAAHAWYGSDAYKEAAKLRQGATSMRAFIIAGREPAA